MLDLNMLYVILKTMKMALRADSRAGKLCNNSVDDFWKEVRTINNSKIPLPTNIEGIVGNVKMVQLLRKHYHDLFNCVNSNLFTVDNVNVSEDMVVRIEMWEAICKLDDNKSCGPDDIFAEHLKPASLRLTSLPAMCMTGFLIHGAPPDTMIAVLLVPVMKDKTGKMSSKDNCRPIALASIMSKVFEKIVFDCVVYSLIKTNLVLNENMVQICAFKPLRKCYLNIVASIQ